MKLFSPDSASLANAIGRSKALAAAQEKAAQEENSIAEEKLFSSMEDDTILSAVDSKAESDSRSMAAAIVIEWAKSETNDFDDLEAMIAGSVVGIAFKSDTEEDEHKIDPDKLTDEDEEDFNELLGFVGEALIKFSGLEGKKIQTFVDDEKNEMASDIIEAIQNKVKGESEDELVADFAVRENIILSSTKKVIRDGKVKYIKKPLRKRKMSAKQRQALKKAQRKANSSAAKAKRKKSNRLRKSRGM